MFIYARPCLNVIIGNLCRLSVKKKKKTNTDTCDCCSGRQIITVYYTLKAESVFARVCVHNDDYNNVFYVQGDCSFRHEPCEFAFDSI